MTGEELEAGDAYSAVANGQLDEIEGGDDPDLYNAILDACELILRQPGRAQSLSAAITTREGIRFRLAVDGHHPYKVFWSSEGPRIEAVFPYPQAELVLARVATDQPLRP